MDEILHHLRALNDCMSFGDFRWCKLSSMNSIGVQGLGMFGVSD